MSKNEIAYLGYGSRLIIPVYGEQYGQSHAQSTLKKLYKQHPEKVTDFSLVPQDDYQKEKGWPEEPFLNVLPNGDFTVSKKSWLGYISPFEPEEDDEIHRDRQAYTQKLVELGKKIPIIIKGKIIKEGDEYSIILFASHKEIDNYLNKLS